MSTLATSPFRASLSYQAGLLGLVCLVVSALLIWGNVKTSVLIEERQTEDKLAMLGEVLPVSLYNNVPVKDSQLVNAAPYFANPVTLMSAKKDGVVSGAVLQLQIQGWGGKIQFIMGVDVNGEITGVRVVSHKETPGLADKIEVQKSFWITGFNGKSLANTSEKNWAVKKDGGEFDQFAGATITPRAVVKGVHQGLMFYQQWQQQPNNSTTENSTPAP